MNDSREALRVRLRADRELLEESALTFAAEAIVEPIIAAVVEHFENGLPGTVAGYFPIHGEIDPGPALDRLRSSGWTTVQPICGDDASMVFAPWAPGEALNTNRYGIPEPTSDPVPAESIDVVLVPGVGFGPDGSRIGHGVGYYDRFFARCFSSDHDPRRLGLAHDEQIVELPPPESWDVGMHMVISPSRVISVSNS